MMKRKLLLILVIFITFIGGFYTGVLFSSKNSQHKLSKKHKLEIAPKSAIKPEMKEIPKPNTTQSKVLIGYVQDFRDPHLVDYAQLTHIIFSFAHPTMEGNILLNGEMALKNLRVTVKAASKYHTKVMLAVGGWYNIQGGESYKYFKSAIATPSSRTNLVKQLNNLVDREKLDGIDLDFEYPRSSVEAKNLTALTKELSGKLHPKGKELSIAVYSKINSVTGTVISSVVYEPSMFQYVDHVNIMAYDGQWDGGYNAANLSPYSFTENVVNYWSNLFKTHNQPKQKLVLGVPFYAQPENPSIKQISYATIVHKNPANVNSDTVRMNGTIYHYNGEATMKKKTKLAICQGFGGMMMWEAGLDTNGKNSLTGTIFNALKDSSSQYTAK
jgi:chitinase